MVVVGLLVVLGEGRRLCSVAPEGDQKFITWNDLKLSDDRLDLEVVREDGNGSNIIVVDQNGKGDVTTVQGAVDMVPEHNSERIKIYILPGIYRYLKSYVFLLLEAKSGWFTLNYLTPHPLSLQFCTMSVICALEFNVQILKMQRKSACSCIKTIYFLHW